jgi:hypothetical protein
MTNWTVTRHDPGAPYLGDGVYMVVHPNSITLYTERENGVHMVSLEPWMILQLARMVTPTPVE